MTDYIDNLLLDVPRHLQTIHPSQASLEPLGPPQALGVLLVQAAALTLQLLKGWQAQEALQDQGDHGVLGPHALLWVLGQLDPATKYLYI